VARHTPGLMMDPNVQTQSGAPAAGQSAPRARLPRLPWRRRRDDAPGPAPLDQSAMTIGAHLTELRNRFFISIFSLVPGSIIGYVFSDRLIEILKAPLPTTKPLIALSLTEPFMIHLEVAVTVGVILAMPVILYQFWRYISPGLTPRERAAARPWVPAAMVFFALGVCVAYFILPYASGFLYGFQTKDIELLLTADAYFGFVTVLFIAFGVVMEFPIVLVLLSKMGIVSSARLRSSRRMAVLGIVIFSELITPGADFVSPIVMAVVMYGLYEVSIILIRLGGR
jgi:sec-independent protein translocase protein TatC